MNDWRPSASLQLIRQRAQLYRAIRAFFAVREVMEVDTPVLSAAAVSDPYLQPMCSEFQGPGQNQGLPLFLQTSPEYAMKRLLAAGSGAIYQLAKSFRNGESGRRHNPEFCMLEWYRPGFDAQQLMVEVEALLLEVAGCGPAVKLSYRQAFQQYLGIDPHPATAAQLQALAVERLDVDDMALEDRDAWLDLLFSHLIEPELQQPTFIYDYPASQAALAQVSVDDSGALVARRFELFINGLELANGYLELVDAAEQASRFAGDQLKRQQMGLVPLPTDHHLVAALQAGMPDCAGVALGVDRLLMLISGCTHIDEVLPFPVSRA
ncbi:MAG: elongation factor P--(R)-beta-lysine ligase [Motiliproteus sp.]